MRAIFDKGRGRRQEKGHGEILKLINRIRSIVLNNDGKVDDIKSALAKAETQLIVKKSGQLRWLVHQNSGRKDRFWTSWYFATKGMSLSLSLSLSLVSYVLHSLFIS
jgi:hypothetical protein